MPLKLITPESSPFRMGLVLFLLSWGYWFVLGVLVSLGIGVLLLRVPFSLNWMWWAAGIAVPISFFTARAGVCTEMRIRRERKAQAERIPGVHPILGSFYGKPYYQFWHAPSVPTSLGGIFFCGPGLAPSDAQAAQCLQIIAQLPRLVTEASAGLLPPPEPCMDVETCEFTLTGVTLSERGDFELSLRAPLISDQIDEYPSATFSTDGVLRDTEWSP
jgi:hypothetical protein